MIKSLGCINLINWALKCPGIEKRSDLSSIFNYNKNYRYVDVNDGVLDIVFFRHRTEQHCWHRFNGAAHLYHYDQPQAWFYIDHRKVEKHVIEGFLKNEIKKVKNVL